MKTKHHQTRSTPVPNPIRASIPTPIPEVIEFTPDGNGAGLYTEVIDLGRIGRLDITRATRVEFDEPTQRWEVFDFTGHRLFTHRSRRVCLDWEHRHFNQ